MTFLDAYQTARRPSGGFEVVRHMGGITGAWLVRDHDGTLFVMKQGADPGHILEEWYADQVYRVLGVPVPAGCMTRDAHGRPTRISVFVEGRSLHELLYARDPAVRRVLSELRRRFAVDALLANWDVIGGDFNNPLLGTVDGIVYRPDNGGALRRRAGGMPKPAGAFSGEPGEIYTMRRWDINPAAARVFGSLSDREIAHQVRGLIVPNRDAVLGVLPEELRATIGARIACMAAWSAQILRRGRRP